MQKTIEELIVKRCEVAKTESEEYLKCSDCDEEAQSVAEILCYKKGITDAIYLLKHTGLAKM